MKISFVINKWMIDFETSNVRYRTDISTFEQGIYIIELTSSELKVRKKLIIKE